MEHTIDIKQHSSSVMRTSILLLLVGAISGIFPGYGQINSDPVHWAGFLSAHDIVYHRLPENYYEGAYAGNGLVGTILYRDEQTANTIRFDVGRTDVYDHRSDEMLRGKYPGGKVRLPIGQLLVTPRGKMLDTDLRIDLWNAEIRGTIVTDKGKIDILCYVPSGEKLIVLKLKSAGAEKPEVRFRPQQGDNVRPEIRIRKDVVYDPNPPFRVKRVGDAEVITQPLLMGDDYATAWNERTEPDGTRSVYITVANRWAEKKHPSHGSDKDAVMLLQQAREKREPEIREAHRHWWHRYYRASFVTFPDKRIESLFWIQQYRLASAGHPDRPVIDLMGPWYHRSPWLACWTNLNVQLTYYTTGITNHPEMEQPLFKLIEKHQNQLVENVPAGFRDECAALGNPVGYDDLQASVFLTNNPDNKTRMSLIALPWLMQEFYLHYRLTMDDNLLRKTIYPLMRKTFAVYLRIKYKGMDGKYHLPLTYSDEYGDDVDTNMNLALARWGFKTLIEAAERLKISDPLLPLWKDFLQNLAPYPIDERGLKIGQNLSFDRPHRHYSHLFAIFPLYETNIDNAGPLLPVLKKSVENYIGLRGDSCMYKFTGASSLWAALGNGNEALKNLIRAIRFEEKKVPTITPNGFYSERGWPTFESPVSACRSALDMYLQSWGNKLRIFPAMPDNWKEGAFRDLRAQGGFLVSASRKNGKTQFIRITALSGETCVIKTDMNSPVVYNDDNASLKKQAGDEYTLTIARNKTVYIIEKGTHPSFEIKPITHQTHTGQYFGLK